MIAAIAAMLPAAAGAFALAVIVLSLLRHGRQALALHRELAACGTAREMRYVLITTRVVAAGECADGFRPADRRDHYRPVHRQARLRSVRAAA